VPRNRSVRLATLGATAQRTASSSYGSRSGRTLGRRAVVVVLVALSLAMITGYFRESENGPLHDVQGKAAQGLEPFQIGAERLVRPFRDAWGWFDELRTAKADKERAQREAEYYRNAYLSGGNGSTPVAEVSGVKQARAPRFPVDFRPLQTDVIADLMQFQQQITVSAGRGDGVRRYDPVVTTHNVLLGHVSKVGAGTSQVTLISDRSSAVSVKDVENPAKGVVEGRGPGAGTLLLDRVSKQDVVRVGDNIVTAGRLSGDDYASFYPSGIGVGQVESVTQSDTDAFKVVHVSPFAKLSRLDSVVILRRKRALPTLP
jgi:rod shape-determining protein MreC